MHVDRVNIALTRKHLACHGFSVSPGKASDNVTQAVAECITYQAGLPWFGKRLRSCFASSGGACIGSLPSCNHRQDSAQ